MQTPFNLIWFRRDLRVADNPALMAAVATGQPVIAVFIHARREGGEFALGAASNWWLHHSLTTLARDLERLSIPLLILRGKSLPMLRRVTAALPVAGVYWNRRYDPALIEVDMAVKDGLQAVGIGAHSYKAHLLLEPWEIATGVGTPYRVFTPFWRKATAMVRAEAPMPEPPVQAWSDTLNKTLDAAKANLPLKSLSELKLLPRLPWADGFSAIWRPGELGAQERLTQFLSSDVQSYRQGRDYPAERITSRLSPHLAFGEISPRQILAMVHAHWNSGMGLQPDADFFVRELFWREFSYHLLFHFPKTPTENLSDEFDHFAWREPDPTLLRAWHMGRTGLPIIDAGMRELWTTGYMHNRVRMLVASVLTKNLRYHWLHGARWFWDTLVDADLANNTQGWQWSAGTGADAAPYFRIFNPVTQGERFDPEGRYVRQFVPELARVPNKFVHQPWMLPASELSRLGLTGTPYARPLIDLSSSRADALDAYKQRHD